MMEQEKGTTRNEGGEFGLLGEYLKQKRTEKNFSLEKLSQKTKISINILKSLEANDFDHLPSAAYIKGFVVSYVKVLGLPMDEAINKMEYTYLNVLGKPFPALNHTKSMPASFQTPTQALAATKEATTTAGTKAREEAHHQPTPHEVIENSDSLIENTKSILPIAIFAAIILAFVGGYKLISSVVESEVSDQKTKDLGPKIESSSALVNPHIQQVKKEEPKVEQGTQTSTPVTTAPVEEAKPAEEKPLPDFPRNFPTVDFKKVKGKLFSVKTDAPENENNEILPEKIKSSMNPALQNVYIRAVDGNTWISYKIDNNPIASVIVSKGNDLFLQGNEIRLFLGNVNVTKIFYNNYLIETPTKSGVKSLIFPEESNEKYYMPLFPKAKDDILYTAEDYMKRMKLEEDELAKRKQD
ncbi:MAG: helix-turn-helix domain-containing protein [Bacteriovoracaceae bacterium]